jgi:hypothetical protein
MARKRARKKETSEKHSARIPKSRTSIRELDQLRQEKKEFQKKLREAENGLKEIREKLRLRSE